MPSAIYYGLFMATAKCCLPVIAVVHVQRGDKPERKRTQVPICSTSLIVKFSQTILFDFCLIFVVLLIDFAMSVFEFISWIGI